MKTRFSIGLLLGLIPLACVAQTAGAPPPGRLLASNCFQCHGTDGNAVSGFERLAGMSAKKFAEEMREVKTETDKAGIMKPHANAYTDAQLREMGRYFASQARTGVAR